MSKRGTLNISTGISEEAQMDSFQNACLSGHTPFAISIAIRPNVPKSVRTQEQVAEHLKRMFEPLVASGADVEIKMGREIQ